METSRPLGLPTHLRLRSQLGAGGTATVWLARDTRRGRDVAVKLLEPLDAPADREVAVQRLEREVRALARLVDVPGIVAAHECGVTAHGQPWVVTEHVAGGSLAERLSRRPLGSTAALQLAAVLATTLGAAHALGVAHGDVTPSNVMFDPSGHALLVDFGLAQLDEDHPAGGCTPAYAPPERLRGGAATPAADMYSLAATIAAAAGGGVDLPEVLARCRSPRASERPTAAEVVAGLPAASGPPQRR